MFSLCLDMRGEKLPSEELKKELRSNGWEMEKDVLGWKMFRVRSDTFLSELSGFRRYLRHQFGQHNPMILSRIVLASERPISQEPRIDFAKRLSKHAVIKVSLMEKETAIELCLEGATPEEFDEAVSSFGENAIPFCALIMLHHLADDTLTLLETKRDYRTIYRNLMSMRSETWTDIQYLGDTQKDKLLGGFI